MTIYCWSNEPVLQRSSEPSQFTSWAFSENVRRLGILSSMGTVGDCYDCENPGVVINQALEGSRPSLLRVA